jgi:hypothetical protein
MHATLWQPCYCYPVAPVPLWHRGVGVHWRAAVRWHVVLVPARWGVLRIGWCAGWGRAGCFALVCCCCCPRYCFLVCGFTVLTALLCCTVVLSGGYSLLVLMTLIQSCHTRTHARTHAHTHAHTHTRTHTRTHTHTHNPSIVPVRGYYHRGPSRVTCRYLKA